MLVPIAAKVIMKVFYAARVCRPDLLRAITFLACTMTKWSADCDRRLHRLMCYVKSTAHHVQVGWIGDPQSQPPGASVSRCGLCRLSEYEPLHVWYVYGAGGREIVPSNSVQLPKTAAHVLLYRRG